MSAVRLPVIEGSWFEFQHHSEVEGTPWNPACATFNIAQWEAKVAEMADAGLQIIVLMATALKYRAFYRTRIFPAWALGCVDPLEVLLTAADRHNMQVFIGGGFFGTWDSPHILDDMDARRRRLQAIGELAGQYAHHPSFTGWYWPNEAEIRGHFADPFIQYVNECSAEARRVTPGRPTMIAPYGTRHVAADDRYVRQLDRLDIDIVAYQDEVGVEKTQVAETPALFERLRHLHNRAARAQLWADVEIFASAGAVYKSALIPAPIDRIVRQLKNVRPFVDRILVYQYLGIMSEPAGAAYAGPPEAGTLHSQYLSYRRELGLPG